MSVSEAARMAHRRRMGMIPSSQMPPTRTASPDDDCGCGGAGKVETSYKPRGTKDPTHGHLKVKR